MKRVVLILILVVLAGVAWADGGVTFTGASRLADVAGSLWDVMAWGTGKWG